MYKQKSTYTHHIFISLPDDKISFSYLENIIKLCHVMCKHQYIFAFHFISIALCYDQWVGSTGHRFCSTSTQNPLDYHMLQAFHTLLPKPKIIMNFLPLGKNLRKP